MKVHIALVGGQTIPVYRGIIYSGAEQIILIHSNSTLENAKLIEKEISKDYEVKLIEFPPVNLDKIFSKLDNLKKELNYDSLSIDITSGTKPWSIAFFEYFHNKDNEKIIYVDQNNKVWDWKTRKNINVKVDIFTKFRLNGNSLDKYSDIDLYDKDDFIATRKIENIRKENIKDFNSLTDYFSKNSNEVFYELPSGSSLYWSKENKEFEISIKSKGKFIEERLKSKNIRRLLLNSGWFEFGIVKVLNDIDGVENLMLNCVFGENKSKNEVDIIFEYKSKLIFIECKTQLREITHIDKFKNVIRNYGGMATKGFLITYHKINETAMSKCDDSGIHYFSIEDNSNEISMEKGIKMLMNSELEKINPI